jgi:hypothetical protein
VDAIDHLPGLGVEILVVRVVAFVRLRTGEYPVKNTAFFQ